MRKSIVLDALFPAIRQQILAATLLEPEKWWYLTELASHLGTSPSSLQRELGALTRSGLLEHRQDGRRTYYKANTASPVFSELHELFGKTAGIIPTLQAEFMQFTDDSTKFDDQWHQWMTGPCNSFPYTSKIQALDSARRRNRISRFTRNHLKIRLGQGKCRFNVKPCLPSLLRSK
jgi:DNA-binding transcriptional ArsR family regulator